MKVLFSLVFFASACCLGQSASTKEDFPTLFAKISKKCLVESQAESIVLTSLIEDDVLPTTKEGKDLIACMMIDLGYYKDGKFDVKLMNDHNKEQYESEEHQNIANKIVQECSEIKTEGMDEGEIALALTNCFIEKKKEKNLPNPDFLRKD